MFPVGYANFRYYPTIGCLSGVRTTKVVCGRGNLESVLAEDLHRRGLEFPDGNLTIDKEKGEIRTFRSFVLSEKGPSFLYSRLYPPQGGFEEMVAIIDRILKKAYIHRLDDAFLSLSHPFEKYLVDNLDFIERATFKPDTSSEAEVQGRVNFPNPTGLGIPKEQAEYSICLSDAFIEEISKMYRKSNNKDLPARRRKILARKEDPLKIDTFLRAVDICPASSKYENRKTYRNLRKCNSFLTDITLKNAKHLYPAPFAGCRGGRD